MSRTKSTAQQQKSEETKRKILAAFLELMRSKDFDKITTKEICALAQVSNGAFFHHFSAKSSLLDYYITAAYLDYKAERPEVLSDNPYQVFFDQNAWTNDFSLRQGISFVTNYYTPKNKILATRGDDLHIFNSTSAFMQETYDAAVQMICRQWVKPGVVPEQIEADFRSLRHGVIFDWCACDGSFDLELSTQRLMLIYFRGISTPEGCAELDKLSL